MYKFQTNRSYRLSRKKQEEKTLFLQKQKKKITKSKIKR